ncbi:MAG: molybdopterin-dependent oxidoreductase [Methanosarcinales archaeon]|nr:molybdopterin-dependent oxidoreductase [Methanosarcinales archaeon]
MMVFSILHWVPSALAAILALSLALVPGWRRMHRTAGRAVIALAVLGLIGYLQAGEFRFYPLDFHTLHSWAGLGALLLTLCAWIPGRRKRHQDHCRAGRAAAALGLVTLVMGVLMLLGQAPLEGGQTDEGNVTLLPQEPASSRLLEVEAREYRGVVLTPLASQGNNAVSGTIHLDRQSYRLAVGGLVEREMELGYHQLLELPAYSELAYMPCVEGWGFDAKWTGFRVADLLNLTGLSPGASYVLFRSADGYSTGLELDYLQDQEILLAYGINDLTLPPERGFPLQLVAKGRYGYKWAKWITSIEVLDEESRGYWESRGYSNSARVGEFPFG